MATTKKPAASAGRKKAARTSSKTPAATSATKPSDDAPLMRTDVNPAGSWPFPVGKRPQ